MLALLQRNNNTNSNRGSAFLYMLIYKFFQLIPVPTPANIFFLNNKGGICTEAVNQGFVNSQRRLCIDKTDMDPMLVKLVEFTY
jgi:hypothetical protein